MNGRLRKITPLTRAPNKTKTESFKRPNHPDFWTSDECRKNEFSGIRQNNIALRWEFWILGNMERTVSFEDVAKDPLALTKVHVDLFQMTPDPKLFERKG